MSRVYPLHEEYKSKSTLEVEIHNIEYKGAPSYLQCDVEVIEDSHFIAASVKEGSWFVQKRDGDFVEIPYECCTHDSELENRAIEMFKKAKPNTFLNRKQRGGDV